MGFIFLLTLLCMFNFSISQNDTNTHQIYIVQLDLPDSKLALSRDEFQSLYKSFLVSSGVMHSQLVHSYRHVMHGFAASLTTDEAKAIENLNEVISVIPDQIIHLQTTHTPSLLGLNQKLGVWSKSNFGKGVIIGIIDSGITPNHPSFNDDGLSPPPKKWKGKCELNGTACNNKLIGARNFLNPNRYPRQPVDNVGHGTHIASTAAGNFVPGANFFGQAYGTAAGMAPLAHLAIYKVCNSYNCDSSNILAGMDAAIEDGVDVLSVSLSNMFIPLPFTSDVVAIAAYGAISNGIFVSCSAGNGGYVTNLAPWYLTVGASTTDRTFKATAVLGNKEEFDGESLFQQKTFQLLQYPLTYEDVNNPDFKGKIVLCDISTNGTTVRDAGGIAMIRVSNKFMEYTIDYDTQDHVLPTTTVSYTNGQKILKYINSTKNPTAAIVFKGTTFGDKSAPVFASFSSIGSIELSPGIIKPDIIGPGNNILAAWNVPYKNVNSGSNFKSYFNIISGTSMSTPHLSGVAALIKSVHPDWSPAAIKSAMMTTADVLNLGGSPILNQSQLPADIFSIGAGHINPSKAIDPGLIYDITPEDYLPYLCGLGYNDKQIKSITKHSVNCSTLGSIPEAELNYPTISVNLVGDQSSKKTYKRTVTNVGAANSTYKMEMEIRGVNISVVPGILKFSETGEKQSYQVIFEKSLVGNVNSSLVEGSLVWKSVYSQHLVRNRVNIQLQML